MDPPTQEELYQRYADRFARMARRRGLHAHDAEDAIQRAFVAVLESSARYKPARGPYDNWAMTIARRSIRDLVAVLRNRHAPPEAAFAVDPIDPAPDSEQRMIEAEIHAVFLVLVNLLPDDLREVLIMADLEEVSMPEIARELGISEQAGYARLRRARRVLQASWEDHQKASTPLLPLGAFTLDQMIDVDRKAAPIDPDLKSRVWDRLVQERGPEIIADPPAIAGLAGGAPLFGMTTLRVLSGVLLFTAGMGAGALLRGALSDGPNSVPSTPVVGELSQSTAPSPSPSARQSSADRLRDTPSATLSASTSMLDASAPRSSASPAHVSIGALPTDGSMVAERAVIQEARLAIRDHDPAKALDALQRHKTEFKKPRLADVRDDLFRQATDMRDAQLHK